MTGDLLRGVGETVDHVQRQLVTGQGAQHDAAAVRTQVERVADEVRDGNVRVELSVLDSPGLRVPLKHGMPGSIEIEVEQASPAALLMRTAGQIFTGTRDKYAAEGR